VAHIRTEREQTTMIDRHLEVDTVAYDCVTPMQQWRLRAEGPARVQRLGGATGARPGSGAGAGAGSGQGEEPETVALDVDVTFEARTPAIGVDGQSGTQQGAAGSAGASVGKGHFEQAGRWHGTIGVDGTGHELHEARGNRDKSWGPRQWGGPRMWRWFSINIGDDVAFGGIRLGTDAGDLHRGWVWRDGRATSVAEWQLQTELADDGLTQRVVHLTVLDKGGRTHELRGDVLRVAPLPRASATGSTVVNEGLTRWTYDGRTGTGIAEYLHQLDPEGRPRVPIE
jgi:hypothetical protein